MITAFAPRTDREHSLRGQARNRRNLPVARHSFKQPAVGDLVGFGISHPCLTFDKWRVLQVVADDYHDHASQRLLNC